MEYKEHVAEQIWVQMYVANMVAVQGPSGTRNREKDAKAAMHRADEAVEHYKRQPSTLTE